MFLTIKLCTHAKLNWFEIELIIYIKMDLALNNLQSLICHKTQPTNQIYPANQNMSKAKVLKHPYRIIHTPVIIDCQTNLLNVMLNVVLTHIPE